MSGNSHDDCLGLRECSSHPLPTVDRGGTPELPWRVFRSYSGILTEAFSTFYEAITVATWHSDSRIEFVMSPAPRGYSYEIRCRKCSATTFTWSHTATSPAYLFDWHLKQHKPGRALDIEVDWEPSACCSVCPDGIGSIRWDNESGEGLICIECRTTWDNEGRSGELREDYPKAS